MYHLEPLIDILLRNTSTGEVSPEVMRELVLNDTSLLREMSKRGFYANVVFLNVFKDHTQWLFIMCLTRRFRVLYPNGTISAPSLPDLQYL